MIKAPFTLQGNHGNILIDDTGERNLLERKLRSAASISTAVFAQNYRSNKRPLPDLHRSRPQGRLLRKHPARGSTRQAEEIDVGTAIFDKRIEQCEGLSRPRGMKNHRPHADGRNRLAEHRGVTGFRL